MVLEPPEDRPMLLRDRLNDLDLPVFRQPFDDRRVDIVFRPLRKRRHKGNASRFPGVVEAAVQAVHDVQLPLARAFDIPQELAEGVVPNFMQLHRVGLEPGDQVIGDRVQVILVRGGREIRLFRGQPLLQVGRHIGGRFLCVLFDPEEAAFRVPLHGAQELLRHLRVIDLFAVISVNLVSFALVEPGDVIVLSLLMVTDAAFHAQITSPGGKCTTVCRKIQHEITKIEEETAIAGPVVLLSSRSLQIFLLPLFQIADLLGRDPDAVPDADRLDIAGVDEAIDRPVGDGEIVGDLIDPVVPFREGAGSRERSLPFFSRR